MENNKNFTQYRLKKNKTKTKIPLLWFEPSSLILSESDLVTIRPPIHYKIDVLLKYKLHNKNVKIREKKGEQQQQQITALRRSYIWFYYELRIGTPRIYSYHILLLGIHPKKIRFREF